MKVTRHPLFTPTDAGSRSIPADTDMITKLEQSFLLLERADPEWSAKFYDRLFKQFPRVRALFPADMTAQRKKLMDALRVVVQHLRSPAEVRPRLLELGRSHVGYGARPEHYPMVATTMVAVMAEIAGEKWSAEYSAEWISALTMVSTIMLEGAAGATT